MRASLLTLAKSIYYLLEGEVPKYTVRIVFILQFLRGKKGAKLIIIKIKQIGLFDSIILFETKMVTRNNKRSSN